MLLVGQRRLQSGGDAVVVTPLLDRLMHHGHLLKFEGKSWRSGHRPLRQRRLFAKLRCERGRLELASARQAM